MAFFFQDKKEEGRKTEEGKEEKEEGIEDERQWLLVTLQDAYHRILPSFICNCYWNLHGE